MNDRRRRTLINLSLGLSVLAVMTAGGMALLRPDLTSQASADPVPTVTVTTGSISATVSADGSVQPATEVAANFETSGTVDSVRVEVGDDVTTGQTLATLDTADAERAVEVARLSLEAAEEGLEAAQAGNTTTEPDTQVVNQTTVARRKAAVTRAQTATQQAQSALQAAQESLANAQRATPVDPAAVAQAQASVDTAQTGYDQALSAQTKAEISLATAQQGTTVAGDTTTTVDEASVANARAKVLEAQATHDDAQAALDACVLTAPDDGTVLAVNGKVGSSVGSTVGSGSGTTDAGAADATSATTSGDFIVIADLDELEVSVAFAESDVADIEVGQAATLTFPGLDGATGAGEVTSISPTATTSSNVVTYAALVAITEHPEGLRLGQSASVTITTASVEEATIVPSVAVTTSGGRSSVTVVSDDVQAVTPVELGVIGADFTQVLSGVDAGQQVVLTSATSTDDSTADSLQGGFPGGDMGGPPTGGGAPPGGMP